ncbi:MAG TPA: hypothetical protein VGS10_04460 [Terracidiphilus sp.]|nr:hypothetical protein [Terracidiphilus sp.]
MSAVLSLCALILVQAGGTGGSSPTIGGFWSGSALIVGILLAVLVGGVLVALIRAGGSRR